MNPPKFKNSSAVKIGQIVGYDSDGNGKNIRKFKITGIKSKIMVDVEEIDVLDGNYKYNGETIVDQFFSLGNYEPPRKGHPITAIFALDKKP